MLDMKVIREYPERVKDAAAAKRCTIALEQVLKLDGERRDLIQKGEELKCKQNQANDDIAALKKSGADISNRLAELRVLSQKIKNIDATVATLNKDLSALLLAIPNIPHESVPVGTEKENKVMREWGAIPAFSFEPKDHLALAEGLGYISMDRGSKITGSGFVLFQGKGARLARALINFMLDLHTKKHGYTEIAPPYLVNRMSMIGTGQLPKLEEDMYALKTDDLFLIPTAEVPVTNVHRDEVLSEEALPVKYTAYSACFRREAGSYGKDTRGLSRVHQFDKVELVKFVKPEESFNELELLVADAEAVLQALALPYRVVMLATGDLSFAASKCYDLEIWAPGSKRWFEVSSCSNFCDFQARRANIRYRSRETNKVSFVHTLNGSGVALPRLIIALLENGQQQDGSVVFPKALEPYLH